MALAVNAQPAGGEHTDDGESPPITLLLVRGPGTGAETGEMRARLETIARRYQPHVELRVISAAEVPEPYRQRPMLGPTVLVLRRGELVGEAMGALPVRELDSVVRCAVEWPSATTAG
ncbi:MAG TPA: hypothetical protein VML75_28795 [Kofleriaceae bacterium]|nr:hypothetical protein [Kofleriaceae bacterium]